MNHHLYMLLLAVAMLLGACHRQPPIIVTGEDNGSTIKESMINANRVIIHSEETQIDSYLQRRGWQMTTLPSNARYRVTHMGKDAAIQPDDTVEVSYRLEALDGTPYYTHQCDTLVVGRRQATLALDELLLQLRYDSQATLIAPSNSAYGVVGDGDRVGSREVIVYVINNINKL